MNILFHLLLVFATLSTTMVAGLVFTFAAIIMPGIAKLDDRSFIKAFQVIDGIIQKGQPLFGIVWVGSILSLLVASVLGFWRLDGSLKWLLLAATLLYLTAVQAPTFLINVPRNNKLQAVEVERASDESISAERQYFEATWNHWNNFRTVIATVVSVILLLLIR